jgi:hypothetical protein
MRSPETKISLTFFVEGIIGELLKFVKGDPNLSENSRHNPNDEEATNRL